MRMNWKTPEILLILWLVLILGLANNGHAEKRVVCYYTNWSIYRPGTAKFSPQNINPYLCTHLIYAFGGFTKDNTLKPFDKYQDIEKGGYAKFTGLKTYNKNLKTMLAIGGWNEGSSRFSPMVADPSRRRAFVRNAVKFLRQNHFDGLDLDWEYPAFRDGGKSRDKNNYADLVQELREEFEREFSKTGRPRLLLSMAIPAGIEYLEKGYDLPRLNDYLDFFNLLSYDYHSAFEPAVNHHSPLYGLEEDNEYNYDNELTIDYTISYLLKHDVSSDKIILGIPTYGRSYTLFNEDATEIGSPADGPGEEGEATREKGYLAYYEICENLDKSDEWEVVQPNPKAMGPYAFRDNQWVGYDDENIVKVKAHYVNEKSLGGIMFWSIDNDDFRGKCHERPYPLIEAAKEAMLTFDSGRSQTTQKPRLSGNKRKPKPQSNNEQDDESSTQLLRPEKRRLGVTTSSNRKRISSQRSNSRNHGSVEDDDDNERIEDAENVGSAVKKTSNKHRSKPVFRTRTHKSGSRRKNQNSQTDEPQNEEIEISKEQSSSNKLTTPEPPTTPDPGTDFKCEDEGFFPHPRDCKKYFWCLDSGPGGLGIVAHQFTCPSGLVFNKNADSCDYPRNVACPKTKSTSTGSTTKAPITAATSKTTFLHSTTRRTTTTEKAESEDEYEYYDEETNVAEDEDKEEITSTTTVKPLIYKTIARSKPTTTTTTSTTAIPITSSPRSFESTSDKVLGLEDEEDPRVIKELIDLIKKAGGLEQLEKQLKLGEKTSIKKSEPGSDEITPATISRSLYERVLSRQVSKVGGFFGTTTTTTEQPKINKNIFFTDQTTKNSRINLQNGPGRSQFEGLDEVPEVKSLRRTNKPHYVTIERQRPSTTESTSEEDTDDFLADEESVDRDTTNVASSEDLAIRDFTGNERESSFKKVTPNYVNIRRPRPTTPANDNGLKNQEDRVDENQHRFSSQERMDENEESKETFVPKFRYTSIQRFRSTTSKSSEITAFIDNSNLSKEQSEPPITTTSLYPHDDEPDSESLVVSTSPLSIEISSTFASKLPEATFTTEEPSTTTKSTISTTHPPRTDPTIFIENFVTDPTITTLPVSSSSKIPVSRTTVAQPRPFGFPRRGRPTSSSSLPNDFPSTTEQSRGKVSTRPTKNFVRTRIRPNQRPSELLDESHLDNEEEKIVDDKTVNRSRLSAVRRGSSRYSTRTPVENRNSSINEFSLRRRPKRPTTSSPLVITEAPFEDRSSSSIPRRRGKSTTPSNTENSTENINSYNNSNKRRRKPTSRSNIDSFSNSPIIRISPTLLEEQFGQLNNTKINSSEPLKVTNIKIIRVYDENEGKNDINNIINSHEATTLTSGTERINSEDFDSVTETTSFFSTTPSLTRSFELINRHNFDNIIDLTHNIISSTENPIEKNEQESEVIRRKVYVRRRPVSSTTEINNKSEVQTKQNRRRKVIRRLYPVSSTANTIDEIESTTVGVNDDGRENEIITTTDSSGLFTTISNDKKLILTDTFTNIPSAIDSSTEFHLNPTTLATEEDTLSINNDIESRESTTVSNPFEDSSTTISTSTLQITTSTTEKPRFVRRKFIRKRPLEYSLPTTSSPSILTARRVGFRPSSDSTFNLNNLSKHRKSLFIRRRPVSSTPSGAEKDFQKDNNNQDDVDDFDDQEEILSQTKKTTGVSHDTESFWKQYTTSSTPLALTPSFQDTLTPSVDDSSPQESADKPGDIVANRESRTYLHKDDSNNDESTKIPNSPIFNSFWQSQSTKIRLYPKRTSLTTDSSVTETLIPSKKFDFAADAAHRKQSLPKITTLPSVNNDDAIELITPSSKPLVTRLVTSIAESGTTERHRILIKTRVSSIKTMTKVTADNKDNLNNVDKKISLDESRHVLLNEIHEPTERVPEKSTLPIESEFARKPRYYFITEPSIESSTIAIESVENTQELPTLKSLISNNNQIINDRDHIENTFSEVKIITANNSPDINIQNDSHNTNFEFENRNSEVLHINANFDGINIPVRIIGDENKEINHQFAVLQFPRSSINSSLRGNILRVEIIDKKNKILKNHLQMEINDKLLDNDHDINDDYGNSQEIALGRKIREEYSTVKNNSNEFNQTSIGPANTTKQPEILILKSQNSLRGFFITKNINDITETITEDVTEPDKEIEIDLPLEKFKSSENNWTDKKTSFLQNTSSFIDDNFFSIDSNMINNTKTQENTNLQKDVGEEILIKNRVFVNNTENNNTLVTENTTLSNSFKETEEKILSAVEENILSKNKWRKRLIRKRLKVPDSEDDQTIAETELEVNRMKNSGTSLRKLGNIIRRNGSDQSKVIARNSTVGETKSDRRNTNNTKPTTFDQSNRAQKLEVSVADPPHDSTTQPSKKKSSRFRESQRYVIDTQLEDQTDVPVLIKTTTSSVRRQQRPRNNNKRKLTETTSVRPRQPAVIDYDYYLDEEVQLSLQRELKDKLYVTREGSIRCLDQGNFAHPTSCKKFINCARMVNGQMIATEYTCPDKLSFDPIGGICNWSAGLGCKKSFTPFV